MKVAIVGSRLFTLLDMVGAWMRVNLSPGDIVVSGGARGVDSEAARIAAGMGLEVTCFLPDWKTHGREAGFIRNRLIVEEAEIVVAFWDGESRGTKNTIDMARKAGKPVTVFEASNRTGEIRNLFQERRFRR